MESELNDIVGRLQAKAEQKRDRAKVAADAEFLADMQSIERIASLDNEGLQDTPNPRIQSLVPQSTATITIPAKDSKRVGGRKNGPTSQLRKIIESVGDGFSVASLAEHLDNTGASISRTAIYSAINKLSEGGEIERMIDGSGKALTSYRVLKLKQIQ